MKKLFVTLLMTLCATALFAQFNDPDYDPKNFNELRVGSLFWLNTSDTTDYPAPDHPGSIIFRKQLGDTSLYVSNGLRYVKVGSDVKALDSAYRSNDTIYFPTTAGGLISVKMTGIPQGNITGLNIVNDTMQNWSLQGPVISYSITKVDDSHTFNLGGDTLIHIFRYDPEQNHVSNTDSVMRRYSYDGGVTWTDPVTIFSTNYVDGNQEVGLMDNGNMVIFMRRYDANDVAGTAQVGYIYSTDKGSTWSDFNQITPLLSNYNMSPFGKIVRLNSGQYMALIYMNGYCESWVSGDNGITWSARGVVYDYRSTNTDRLLAEPMAARLRGDSIIILGRDQLLGGPFFQLASSDDGETWTWQGRTNIGTDSSAKVAPCIMFDSTKNAVITIHTIRHVDNSASAFQYNTKNDSLIVYISKPDEVFSNPTKYRKLTGFARPEPDVLSMYGYADLVRLDSGDWTGIFTERVNNYPGEKSHFWQFDLKFIENYSDQFSSRFGGLSPVKNRTNGLYDLLSFATQGELVNRLDSIAVVRPNSTLELSVPGWGGNILRMRSKVGNLLHTFGPTGRVLINNPNDDFSNTLQVTGGIRLTGQLRMQGGSPAAGRIMQSDANGVGSWIDGGTKFINNNNTSPQTASSWISGTQTAQSFQVRDSMTDVLQLRNASGDLRWSIGSVGSNYDLRISLFNNSGNRSTIARFNRITGQASFGYGVSPSLVPLSVFSSNGVSDQGLSDLMFGAATQSVFGAEVGATIGVGGMYSPDSTAWFGAIKGGKANSISGSRAGFLSFYTGQSSSVLTERIRIDSIGNLGVGTTTPAYRLDVAGSSGQINAMFAGRVILDNAVNTNEAVTLSQLNAVNANAVKNNANNQTVITPFNIKGSGSGSSQFSVLRMYESDGTTLKGIVGDNSSADEDIYVAAYSTGASVKLYTDNAVRLTANSTGVTIAGILTLGAVKWITGTGTPEGNISAPVGSIYSRTDGGAATTLYVKESGTGNTGWIAK